MAAYDTNLAAEFYVLSCLHRRGLAAALTLGNKKGVDIYVNRLSGTTATVEVKGVAGKHDWPVDNLKSKDTAADLRHYVVLVSFEGVIDDPKMPAPSVWVIPFDEIGPFIKEYETRRNVSRSLVKKNGEKYVNAWHFIE